LADIANVKLQELTLTHVQKLYQSLPQLSPRTVHKVHKLLKDMITKALELEMIQKNIMLPVKAPKFEKKEIKIFSPSEAEIHIRKSLQESSVLGLSLESPKTKAAIRKIKITNSVVPELAALKTKQKISTLNKNSFVFSQEIICQ